jgi:alkanesulfonate monooxygenase SsuD/methylene tetrahydromethanopterin reductase-like flavin-dependent oxidoreductase (luciferase family)
MPCVTPLRLAVALPGAADSRAELAELAREAERGKLDFATFEAPPELITAEIAALTSRIGLVATQTGSDSGALAALESASSGRAGFVDHSEIEQAGDAVRVAVTPSTFALRCADLILTTPADEDDVRRIVAEIRAEESAAGRIGSAVRIFADLVVFLDRTEPAANARRDDLGDGDLPRGTAIFAGTAAQLEGRLRSWQRAGIEGFRLRPAQLPHDLTAITRELVPSLQENDAFRRGYEAKSLRALLGLPRVAGLRPEQARV